jgi:hypothetical protein
MTPLPFQREAEELFARTTGYFVEEIKDDDTPVIEHLRLALVDAYLKGHLDMVDAIGALGVPK